MRNLQRDPYARETHIKQNVRVVFRTCAWCGDPGKELKSGEHLLYRYGVETDNLRDAVHLSKEVFCCKSCYESYSM